VGNLKGNIWGFQAAIDTWSDSRPARRHRLGDTEVDFPSAEQIEMDVLG
jgi:hypothetical protein